jgi:hypothetical protein
VPRRGGGQGAAAASLPRRVATLAVAVIVAVTLARAAAHGTTIPHDLAGVAPCVDDASIEVSFDRDEDGRVAELVAERLARSLERTLGGAGVPWRRHAHCPAARGYVSIGLDVSDASWYAPRAAVYELRVHVGWRRTGGGVVRADPPDAFDFTVSELFDERAVGVPAFVYLPGYVEAALRDLAVSWWEDQRESAAPPWWLPVLGLAAASVTGLAAARWARRSAGRGSASRGPSA